MRLFDQPQAKYFCAPAPATIAGVSSQSLPTFHSSLGKSTLLVEGTTPFQVHQVNLLNSVERWLLYSLGHYRRAVDMLVPASAPWAQVTLYYGSFFAANAILGIFGGWIGHTQNGNIVVDVERGASGTQALKIYRRLKSPSNAGGSHKAFWDFFYDSVPAISAWAPPALAQALTPVNGDYAWQIGERNSVNYDMFGAWNATAFFHGTFKPARFNSLRGPLQLQLDGAERMIRLALHFASIAGLSGGAIAGAGPTGTRLQIQKKLVTQAPPSIAMQSGLYSLFEI
jgi:hypothetical protein